MLWIYCALVGAYYVSVKRHAPDWKVELTARDLAYLVAINAVLFIGIFVYVKLKVG